MSVYDRILHGLLTSESLNSLVDDLHLAFTKVDKLKWAAVSPESDLWICVLGTAVARNEFTSGVWVSELIRVTVSLQGDLIHGYFLDAWSQFCWLRELRVNVEKLDQTTLEA